ncbi:hydrolase, partial [Oryctes borbonicus]
LISSSFSIRILNRFLKMSLRKSVLSRGSKRMSVSTKDFSPITWTRYFDNKKFVSVNGSLFNVYVKGSGGPGIVALHGGGYSGLTWALFAEEITTKINCHILAIDLRGHGLTSTTDDADLDLATLANDINDVIRGFYMDEIPPIVLIGHSMGGAVAVEAASIVEYAVGLCVIDVVEGSALESLSAMQNILRGRPTSFPSLEHAIQWSFRSGQTHNLEAARVSVPGQIKNLKTGQLGTHDA